MNNIYCINLELLYNLCIVEKGKFRCPIQLSTVKRHRDIQTISCPNPFIDFRKILKIYSERDCQLWHCTFHTGDWKTGATSHGFMFIFYTVTTILARRSSALSTLTIMVFCATTRSLVALDLVSLDVTPQLRNVQSIAWHMWQSRSVEQRWKSEPGSIMYVPHEELTAKETICAWWSCFEVILFHLEGNETLG